MWTMIAGVLSYHCTTDFIMVITMIFKCNKHIILFKYVIYGH